MCEVMSYDCVGAEFAIPHVAMRRKAIPLAKAPEAAINRDRCLRSRRKETG